MRISDWSSDVCSSDLNQLAWKLRQDDRVIVHEQTSARILTAQHIPEPIDLILCDASFIALSIVLPVPLSFARPWASLVAPLQHQFHAARHQRGKRGLAGGSDAPGRAVRYLAPGLGQTGDGNGPGEGTV